MANLVDVLLAESNEQFSFVKVFYTNSDSPVTKSYTYKTVKPVKEGDQVVVYTPQGQFKVVVVDEVIPAIEMDLDLPFEVKWIVDVIDMTHYNECLDMQRTTNKQINRMNATVRRKELFANIQNTLGENGIDKLKALVKL